MAEHRIALLTAGGLAPCLSSAVGGLIERYTERLPNAEIIAHGFFPPRELPEEATGATRARISEVLAGAPPPLRW